MENEMNCTVTFWSKGNACIKLFVERIKSIIPRGSKKKAANQPYKVENLWL